MSACTKAKCGAPKKDETYVFHPGFWKPEWSTMTELMIKVMSYELFEDKQNVLTEQIWNQIFNSKCPNGHTVIGEWFPQMYCNQAWHHYSKMEDDALEEVYKKLLNGETNTIPKTRF